MARRSTQEALDGLPDAFVEAINGYGAEQFLFAVAVLTQENEFVAAHHELIEHKLRVTVLTSGSLLVVEGEPKDSWRDGHLVDEDIEVRIWRHADIESVTPRSLHLFQPRDKSVRAAFERLDVHLAGLDKPMQLPVGDHPDHVSASEELRNGIWRTWLSV